MAQSNCDTTHLASNQILNFVLLASVIVVLKNLGSIVAAAICCGLNLDLVSIGNRGFTVNIARISLGSATPSRWLTLAADLEKYNLASADAALVLF